MSLCVPALRNHAAKATMLIAAKRTAGPNPTNTIMAANMVSAQATSVSIDANLGASLPARSDDSLMRVDTGLGLGSC